MALSYHATVRAPQDMYKTMSLSPEDADEGVMALKDAGLFVPIASASSELTPKLLTLEFDTGSAVASASQPGDENKPPQGSGPKPLVLPPSPAQAGEPEQEEAADVAVGTGTSAPARSTAVVVADEPEKPTAPTDPRKRSQAVKASEITALSAQISASQPPPAAPPAPGGVRLPPCAGKKDAPDVAEPASMAKAKGRGAKRAPAQKPAAAAKAARGTRAAAPGAASKKAAAAKAAKAPAPKPTAATAIATCVIAPKAGKAHDVIGLRKTATDNDDESDFYKASVKRSEYVTILEEASSESGTEYVLVTIGKRHGWVKKAYVTRITPMKKKAAAGRKVASDEDEGERPAAHAPPTAQPRIAREHPARTE